MSEVSDTNRPFAHPIYQVLSDTWRQRFLASAAKDHAAHLITHTFDLFRIGAAPEALGEVEEFLLFALLSLEAVLDELQQHANSRHAGAPGQHDGRGASAARLRKADLWRRVFACSAGSARLGARASGYRPRITRPPAPRRT